MSRLLTTGVLIWLFATAPDVAGEDSQNPKEIAVPAGHKQLFSAHAKGVQIYKSAAGKDGRLEWVLEGPLAELTNDKGERVGCHFGEPTLGVPAWEASDGSRIVKVDVKSLPAPKPDADIPWLIVRVKSDEKAGTLAKVDYVKRIETHAGKSPTEAPKRLGTRIGVPYEATYIFFAK